MTIYTGTTDDDTFNGSTGDDQMTGNDGTDKLTGNAGNDTLSGGSGIDTLDGGDGKDSLDGGAGNDILTGGLGNDTYLFGKGDGQDVLNEEYDPVLGKLNILQFKAGVAPSEIIAQRSGNNLLLKIAGTTDSLKVTSFFGSDDPANFFNPLQQINFNDGTSWDLNTITAKAFLGSADDDISIGTVKNDLIYGGAGSDQLSGKGGNDSLFGGEGIDTLDGGDGKDSLDGGAGNDILTGGYGNDTYWFGKGDGQDVLNEEYDPVLGKLNILQIKAGVAPSEIIAQRSGSNLLLKIAGTTDSLKITSFFGSDDPANFFNPLQQINFNDGTSWDLSTITAKAFLGSAEDDISVGTINNDLIYGGAGSDQLSGKGGNDSLFGGEGIDTLDGGDGKDTLDGGVGNDILTGGYGNDTYLFGKGDGQDVLNEEYDPVLGKLNILQFKAGVVSSEIIAQRSGNNLLLKIAATTDSLKITSFFGSDDPANIYNPLQQINFNDGTVWDLNTITAKAFLGSADDDISVGTVNNDLIYGGAGSDQLSGKGGNDSLFGGEGIDTLDGGDGKDTLDGGAGNDILTGGLGNDTYLFGKGDGQDVLNEEYDPVLGKLNILQFKAGVAPSEIIAQRSGNNLLLKIAGTTDSLKVTSFFGSDDPANFFNPLQQINFNDGTSWDLNTITAKAFLGSADDDISIGTVKNDLIYGGAGSDQLSGKGGNDSLFGGEGIDTLDGGDGNDTLDAGAGNDILTGGLGNDTYWFGMGDGRDVLNSENDTAISKQNILQFKAGIVATDINCLRTGNDLLLVIQGSNDTFKVTNFYAGNSPSNQANPLQQINFSDGTIWDLNAIVANTTLNQSPVLTNPITDQSVQINSTINFQLPVNSFTDSDVGDFLSYTATLANGTALPGWLSFDAVNRIFTGTPNNNELGAINVKVTAIDKSNISVSDTFTITVVSANNTPIVNAIPDLFASEDVPINFQLPANSFVDQDSGDALSYVATLTNGAALPAWLSFNATTRTFTGTPNASAIGALDVKVTALDKNNASATDTFTINVAHTNHAPRGSDKLVTTPEDTSYVFSRNDFGFIDVDSSDQLQALQLSSLPSNGNLTLNGVAVSVGQIISAADIDAHLLVFAPAEDANGSNYAGFDFKVGDGSAFSATDAHVSIDVTAVADVKLGTPRNDTLLGYNDSDDVLKGLAGNDKLQGLSGDDELYGDEGKDTLDGGAGDDVLDGGSGADKMLGGVGDDDYIVDNAKDVVTESSNAGIDLIRSSLSFKLPKNVENLLLINGSAAKNATGNNLSNLLTGNQNANKLDGGAGNDVILGNEGNDTLLGGAGNDSFVFSPGAGRDVIKDFGDKSGNNDVIDLSDFGISFENLNIVGSGKNSVITVDGIDTSEFQITLLGVKSASIGADDFNF